MHCNEPVNQKHFDRKCFTIQVLGPTPQAYIWALENKIFACLMVSSPAIIVIPFLIIIILLLLIIILIIVMIAMWRCSSWQTWLRLSWSVLEPLRWNFTITFHNFHLSKTAQFSIMKTFKISNFQNFQNFQFSKLSQFPIIKRFTISNYQNLHNFQFPKLSQFPILKTFTIHTNLVITINIFH